MKPIGIPGNMSLGATASSSARAEQLAGDLSSGAGFRSSVVNNFSLPGSTLTASTSGGGGMPYWALWAAGAVLLAFFVWQYVKK